MNCQIKLSFSNETSLILVEYSTFGNKNDHFHIKNNYFLIKSAYFSFIFRSKMTIFQIITVRNWWIAKLKYCFRMSFDQKQPKTDRYHVL